MIRMERIELHTPLSEKEIRRLNIGDQIFLSGTIITGRDAAHKRIIKHIRERKNLPFSFDGLALYHCGPLVRKVRNGWMVLAAGPTTSMRMEPFESEVIEKLGIRLIIGKGGMGEKTKEAMRRHGAVYGAFPGGAAVLAAKHIKRVIRVEWLDLGMPEAVWIFEVDRFGPIIVGMDSHGGSLYEEAKNRTLRNLSAVFETFVSE